MSNVSIPPEESFGQSYDHIEVELTNKSAFGKSLK